MKQQVLVEQFLPVDVVEALDACILIGVARLDVLSRHAGLFGPARLCLARELRTVVGSEHLGQSMLGAQPLEDAYQVVRGN